MSSARSSNGRPRIVVGYDGSEAARDCRHPRRRARQPAREALPHSQSPAGATKYTTLSATFTASDLGASASGAREGEAGRSSPLAPRRVAALPLKGHRSEGAPRIGDGRRGRQRATFAAHSSVGVEADAPAGPVHQSLRPPASWWLPWHVGALCRAAARSRADQRDARPDRPATYSGREPRRRSAPPRARASGISAATC